MCGVLAGFGFWTRLDFVTFEVGPEPLLVPELAAVDTPVCIFIPQDLPLPAAGGIDGLVGSGGR